MARTDESAVKDILDHDPRIKLPAFIRTAAALVDWLDSQDEDSELSDSLLTEIETWLAAHFYSHRDQQLQSTSRGGASGQFQGQTGMVLMSTYYGQTACLLDVTGILSRLSKQTEMGGPTQASLTWLGNVDDSPRPDNTLDEIDE